MYSNIVSLGVNSESDGLIINSTCIQIAIFMIDGKTEEIDY